MSTFASVGAYDINQPLRYLKGCPRGSRFVAKLKQRHACFDQ
jgi:hypothetical protein